MAPADAAPETEEHLVVAAMKRAPVGEPFPPEIQAYLDHRMGEIAAGRARLVRHEDLPAALEEMHLAERGDEQ